MNAPRPRRPKPARPVAAAALQPDERALLGRHVAGLCAETITLSLGKNLQVELVPSTWCGAWSLVITGKERSVRIAIEEHEVLVRPVAHVAIRKTLQFCERIHLTKRLQEFAQLEDLLEE
ncbi:MAG TPA: hypothetical protein VG433_04090 [Pirellulales bacterium]|nr:hypothetical protein [Pirellulales bacterium]